MIAGSDGALLAALIAEAGRGPAGSEDLSDYTGQILAWDALSGTNVVHVNGADIPNMRVVQSGVGLAYQPGDVVNIMRRGTQWFILGKIGAPGAGAGNQIASRRIAIQRSIPAGGDFADLTGSYGPEVSLYIGSSRRCLVIHSFECAVSGSVPVSGEGALARGAGFQAVQVSGASSLPVETAVTDAFVQNGWATNQSVTASTLVTAANGLNAGLNVFTCKYRATADSGLAVQVNNRVLTVIPF
ncbi:hypothetical protein [Amycolatopsis jiangsuensis]|uniref:Uncharacterized protein n=1 Tax=Amycolatopsis jiangsuensis TaxID=1181879 RepID=A0A840J8U2_9PSEU|nr:hypothetical protein [Amycolatopsis jiangsuensis]MBB4689832.1 hypothetical protein [Amycolatopsis jiangsuensis]